MTQERAVPDYAKDRPFRILMSIAEAAGMRIEFAAVPDSVYARSRGTLIQMPLEGGRFRSAEHAAIVLGHELAHAFVNEQYPPPDADKSPVMATGLLVEAECDHLGAYFYMLALRIARQEAADRVARAQPEGQA